MKVVDKVSPKEYSSPPAVPVPLILVLLVAFQ